MSLRYYQQEASDKGLEYFFDRKQKKPVIEIIPTAGGKSHVLADIASKLDAPLVIFQPSREILLQNLQKIQNAGMPNATVYSASCGEKEISNVTLAMIGSIWDKGGSDREIKEAFKMFKYIIVDECHLFSAKPSMYRSFFDAVGEKMIGFTATPWRQSTDGFGGTQMKFLTRTNPRVFSKVIHVTQIKELEEQGYLAKTEYYPVNGFDRSKIRLNSTGADFDEVSERQYYDAINYDKRILQVIERLLDIGKTSIICFTKFVKESKYLAEKLGNRACYVSGEMSIPERTRNLSMFKNEDRNVLFNVGVTKLGYDDPRLQVMVDTSPTRSLTTWMQKVGRVKRIHPDKETGWVVDLCNNLNVFGKVEDMDIVEDGKNQWVVMSKGRQLTNIYYDQIASLK